MNAFNYVAARSAESAVELVRDGGRFLAGGMDLLGEMKESLVTPKTLVNIKTIPGLAEVRQDGGKWIVGANVTLAALAGHPDLRRALPGLAEAATEVGSPQIRNVATVGGNLAQHSRCWYYRHHDVECRKKGGTTCFARQGQSKYHALFAGSPCVSPCVSNLAPILAALDARAIVQRGRRTQPQTIADLYAEAWRSPTAHNSLRPEELIVRIEIPAPGASRSAYLQVAEKADFDWALVSCAAAARVDGLKLSGVRVALGAIAPGPWQVDAANALLEGKVFSPALAEQAAEAMLREARPFADNAYKIPIARALVRRTLARLVA